jgi:hypothetical protein
VFFFYGGLHLYLPSLSAPCVPTVKIEFWSFCEIGWRTYVSEHASEDKSACHMPPCTRTSTHTLLSIHTSQTHGHAFEVPTQARRIKIEPAYPEQAEVLKIAMLSHNPRNTCAKVTLLSRHIRAQPRIKDLLRTPLPASAFSKVNLLFLQKPPISVGNAKKYENVRPCVLRKLTLRLSHATIRVRPQKRNTRLPYPGYVAAAHCLHSLHLVYIKSKLHHKTAHCQHSHGMCYNLCRQRRL